MTMAGAGAVLSALSLELQSYIRAIRTRESPPRRTRLVAHMATLGNRQRCKHAAKKGTMHIKGRDESGRPEAPARCSARSPARRRLAAPARPVVEPPGQLGTSTAAVVALAPQEQAGSLHNHPMLVTFTRFMIHRSHISSLRKDLAEGRPGAMVAMVDRLRRQRWCSSLTKAPAVRSNLQYRVPWLLRDIALGPAGYFTICTSICVNVSWPDQVAVGFTGGGSVLRLGGG